MANRASKEGRENRNLLGDQLWPLGIYTLSFPSPTKRPSITPVLPFLSHIPGNHLLVLLLLPWMSLEMRYNPLGLSESESQQRLPCYQPLEISSFQGHEPGALGTWSLPPSAFVMQCRRPALNGCVTNAEWGLGLARIDRLQCVSESRNSGLSELGGILRNRVQPNDCI